MNARHYGHNFKFLNEYTNHCYCFECNAYFERDRETWMNQQKQYQSQTQIRVKTLASQMEDKCRDISSFPITLMGITDVVATCHNFASESDSQCLGSDYSYGGDGGNFSGGGASDSF